MEILYAVLIISAIGLVFGIILSVASKFLAVPVDERQEKIREALPGANCGACGFSGCDGYAKAINDGTAEPNLCTAGGEATAKALSEILGADIKTEKKVAFVKCNHGPDKAVHDYAYSGAVSCAGAAMLWGGPLGCKYGCMGLGDCVNACDYGAITVTDGTAAVNKDLCVGCTKCAKVCPKNIIEIVPCSKQPTVACSNKQKGAAARKVCTAACIGCMKCEKVCKYGAVTVKDNLAYIDKTKCTGCGECTAQCPTKCIV